MAGVASAQYGGPTPWWELPNYKKDPLRNPQGTSNPVTTLQSSAPSGYEYDPVKMDYTRTPTSAGQRVNQYTSAAMGGSLQGLLSAAGIGGAGVKVGVNPGTSPAGGGPVTGGGGVSDIAPIDMTAANGATFARAKDTAGQIGRSSLDSLRGALAETGQLGSGAEVAGTRDVAENAAGIVGDVNRSNAINESAQGLDVAKTNQAAKLTQRGQDINAQEANARLQMAQTQLEYQRAQQESQRQLDYLKLILGQANQGGSAASSFLY